MQFDSDLAAIRFGCGLSPRVAAPASVTEMLTRLQGPDEMARRFLIASLEEASATVPEYRRLNRQRRQAENPAAQSEAEQAFKALRRKNVQDRLRWHGQRLLRQVNTSDGLRERLTLFWADHFTAQGKSPATRMLAAPYAESVIRPHLTGRFEEMLIAVVTSPLMLHYLDQNRSTGPGSPAAKQRKGRDGLNENLAREVLELHTLGVDGPYSQTDVRELAELFTGLGLTRDNQFVFRPRMAEPGAETVLGQSYGGGRARLEQVLEALRDLARHPATARHIAWKLAVHFTADKPDPDLVEQLAARYQSTDGDLLAVYQALLEHPAAWAPKLANVKPPFDYVASACRALGLNEDQIAGLRPGQQRRLFLTPLTPMGQRWGFSNGPDGWPEEDSAWITPAALAARLRWALAAPRQLTEPLPDPRQFAATALGHFADARVQFAAGAAETRAEAIGLVLSAPAFQRR